MTNLLLTHSKDSNTRIRDNLDKYGINCVEIDFYGDIYLPRDINKEIDVGLVYPSRIMEGGVLDVMTSINWVNGLRDILITRNKAQSIFGLQKNGLNTPKTWYVSNPVDFEQVEDEIQRFPVVVKPNSTTMGRGVVKVDDMDSLRGVFDYFSVMHESSLVWDRSFLVQEFIDNASDFRVMVVDGEYVGCVERSSDGWKKNVHRGGDVSKANPPGNVVDLAEKAASSFGISFCGVDILYDGDGYVVELNGRPTVDDSALYLESFYEKLADVVLNKNNK